ncbi:UNVERIFIED_CONTAM: Cytosolic endo-beta-N-acetylglucosaminidase 1 [Sesamum latifolium]|uniref:Cytosolic endo-beta-N-acetylglucosaminidase 1 n=1 Tax=Sesamum latifolium TaxID=2727402 RepID=A0AAW2T8U4_9LAMI
MALRSLLCAMALPPKERFPGAMAVPGESAIVGNGTGLAPHLSHAAAWRPPGRSPNAVVGKWHWARAPVEPLITMSHGRYNYALHEPFFLKEASYNGGGNISFTGTLDGGAEFTARLFEGELLLGNSTVDFTYSVKSNRNSQLGLALVLSSATDERKSVLLAASGNTLLTMNQFSSHYTTVIMPRQVTKAEGESKWILQESRLDMAGHTLKEIRAVCYRSKLEKSAEAVNNTLSDGPSEYYAILGDIKITTAGDNSKFPPSDSWLVDGQFVSWTSGSQGSKLLSVKISWQLKVGNADPFPKYNIYINKQTGTSSGNPNLKLSEGNKYLGVAVAKSFYIADLEVPSGISSLKFIIQVYGLDGARQKLEDSPFLLLQVDVS